MTQQTRNYRTVKTGRADRRRVADQEVFGDHPAPEIRHGCLQEHVLAEEQKLVGSWLQQAAGPCVTDNIAEHHLQTQTQAAQHSHQHQDQPRTLPRASEVDQEQRLHVLGRTAET